MSSYRESGSLPFTVPVPRLRLPELPSSFRKGFVAAAIGHAANFSQLPYRRRYNGPIVELDGPVHSISWTVDLRP